MANRKLFLSLETGFLEENYKKYIDFVSQSIYYQYSPETSITLNKEPPWTFLPFLRPTDILVLDCFYGKSRVCSTTTHPDGRTIKHYSKNYEPYTCNELLKRLKNQHTCSL